ncbi:Gfo/Idh/MocA family oxidoreductase [Microbacterium sp. M3]|jgi:scyllo-inositol 2-dehydrogenase (NADP+)|uniref:Gfo/Idh/MocA family oxidoreductase n=1 Tax=Microbacterium arthrosphaerae TaxID=792652 RepID=A0ABU4H2W0_9MICO|nr:MULTISPECIES: Gfo/Idh/MocA family oxidoreductase [Microbacterium]MDW4573615.1 Gfo/Idh/MocA family oxidoreductase [Microbacterium arthrosphaerae]MDW7607470.1 Gfo/Idh/MocA family oxidoreductase [Microbacterium sp. M3]
MTIHHPTESPAEVASSTEPESAVRLGVVGAGKMGLSHLSIARALEHVEVVGVCDATDYLLDILGKYTGVRTFGSAERMMGEAQPDAILIATPTGSHAALVGSALDNGLHVFCEKPLTLRADESRELAQRAAARGLVAQVGYHNRFIATFQEVKRLLAMNAIGRPGHILAEAYGPVVLKQKGSTWRSRRATGGGCLYDYAAHPIDLVNWYAGTPGSVRGSVLHSIFSSETDDEVYSTFLYDDGLTAHISVNWSDDSYRKMSTSVTVSGSAGRIFADRQEIRVYLRDGVEPPPGYRPGWNVRYTTELTPPVSFYLRGEEYTAQLESFFDDIHAQERHARQNSFDSAAATDAILDAIVQDAERPDPAMGPLAGSAAADERRRMRRRWGLKR